MIERWQGRQQVLVGAERYLLIMGRQVGEVVGDVVVMPWVQGYRGRKVVWGQVAKVSLSTIHILIRG